MIYKIEINEVAIFQGTQILDGLKEFNFFFGANGSGKTTISRVISSPDTFPSCSVLWENQSPLDALVYNRDFINRNFNQKKLPGVFTLGEAGKEIYDKIEATKESIKKLQDEINALNYTLQGADGNGGKNADLSKLIRFYRSRFFTLKQKHSDKLSGTQPGEGMRGFIGSQDSFMKKVLTESTSNKAALLTLAELEDKARTIFSNIHSTVNPIPEIASSEILLHENNPILQKRIIGKNDVDIASLINKLNNSDWVRQGILYHEECNGICPFCQQPTSEEFQKSLAEYFDESFMQDSNTIRILIDNYSTDASRLQSQIQQLIDMQSKFLDIEKLVIEKQFLDSIITINKQRLIEKQKESSRAIILETHANVLTNIDEIIATANERIADNNWIVSDLRNEKATLTSQIWKFVISELATDIAEFNRIKSNIDSDIADIKTRMQLIYAERIKSENELRELEKHTTSIAPTRDDINHILSMFGFKSFALALGDEPNTYKLIREDGSDAKNTLSEGEKNFLTFLYFYHLLKGSQSETGIDNDKIVVIDDPISSLDNDVLFIISTLIRELIQEARDKRNSIKQMFILTHNINFYKEVTYNKKRNNGLLKDESFWIVKKNDKVSIIEKQTMNPIKTSYELLWDEVRSDNRNNATIHNTLRRILENYFKFLGGIPIDELYKNFEGEDKLICKALCSWVNDGSHSAFDEEIYTPLDSVMIKEFLAIFKRIFEKTGQIAHYNMMMGIASGT